MDYVLHRADRALSKCLVGPNPSHCDELSEAAAVHPSVRLFIAEKVGGFLRARKEEGAPTLCALAGVVSVLLEGCDFYAAYCYILRKVVPYPVNPHKFSSLASFATFH